MATDLLLRRRRLPQLEPAQHPVPDDEPAEEFLVLPLHLGHGEEAVDQLLVPACGGVDGGVLVLDDVVPLELPGPVDRSEPAADVAERRDRLADAVEDHLADAVRPRAEVAQHRPDQLAVVPLLRFDRANALARGRVAHAVPVPAIGVASGELAGVGAPELADEFFATIHGNLETQSANAELRKPE